MGTSQSCVSVLSLTFELCLSYSSQCLHYHLPDFSTILFVLFYSFNIYSSYFRWVFDAAQLDSSFSVFLRFQCFLRFHPGSVLLICVCFIGEVKSPWLSWFHLPSAHWWFFSSTCSLNSLILDIYFHLYTGTLYLDVLHNKSDWALGIRTLFFCPICFIW